jgi:hypothetical protein
VTLIASDLAAIIIVVVSTVFVVVVVLGLHIWGATAVMRAPLRFACSHVS